ncbi:MAG: cysteine synthase family protein [Proteobacteria bacterium]|nr:cysteine synthase family protein [Pseudomonadota bacterium]NBP13881.1 cysteine synthase family protein [bacterium]
MHYPSVLQAIGNTPLIQIPFDTPATVLAKLEYLNPGGSVKDRSALYMVEKAEQEGKLKPGGTLIDASSGNHGIALAMIGAAKGYKVIITVTAKCSKEKLQTLQAYGAQIVMCKSTEFITDPESYHYVAQRLAKETPNSFMPNQYYNEVNRDAHYSLLGPEIFKQTNGRVTHFFAGSGTGGTVSGVGRYLKEQNPNVKIFALDAANSFRATNGNPKPYKVEGIGIDFSSDVIDYKVIDEVLTVTDQEALSILSPLAHQYGLLVGPSSGAVAAGFFQKIKTLTKDDVVVLMFSDSGRAYLSKNFYGAQDEIADPLYKQTNVYPQAQTEIDSTSL